MACSSTTGVGPAGVAIIYEILGDRELCALRIHDQPGRWCMRIEAYADVSVGAVVFKVDGFDTKEIIAVQRELTVIPIVGVAAAIVTTPGKGGGKIRMEGWRSTDGEGACAVVIRYHHAKGGGNLQSAAVGAR